MDLGLGPTILAEHVVTVSADPIALARREVAARVEVAGGGNRSWLATAGATMEPMTVAMTKVRPWHAGVGVRQYLAGNFDTGLGLGAELGWGAVGAPTPRAGHPVGAAYLVAKASLAVFSAELRVGGEVGGTLRSLQAAPLVGFGLGLSF